MLERISESFVAGKQHVADFVLVQNRLRFLQCQQVEIVLQHTRVFENVHPAIHKHLQPVVVPTQVATPEIEVQHRTCWGMSSQDREDFSGIFLGHRILQLRRSRPIVDHGSNHQEHYCSVNQRCIPFPAVRREEIQNLGSDRSHYDGKQKQKPHVSEATVQCKEQQKQFS